MIWTKLIPWAGYPIAALMFWFWLEGRENLAIEIEACNTRTIETVAEAESVARRALQSSHERRLRDMEIIAKNEREAREAAEMAASDARIGAETAQATIRRLINEANNDEMVTIERACLSADIPADILRVLD